jgi:hypothetical protein
MKYKEDRGRQSKQDRRVRVDEANHTNRGNEMETKNTRCRRRKQKEGKGCEMKMEETRCKI